MQRIAILWLFWLNSDYIPVLLKIVSGLFEYLMQNNVLYTASLINSVLTEIFPSFSLSESACFGDIGQV